MVKKQMLTEMCSRGQVKVTVVCTRVLSCRLTNRVSVCLYMCTDQRTGVVLTASHACREPGDRSRDSTRQRLGCHHFVRVKVRNSSFERHFTVMTACSHSPCTKRLAVLNHGYGINRFSQRGLREQLSMWLRPYVVDCADFGHAQRHLHLFFRMPVRCVALLLLPRASSYSCCGHRVESQSLQKTRVSER